jgi:hypothetical protein
MPPLSPTPHPEQAVSDRPLVGVPIAVLSTVLQRTAEVRASMNQEQRRSGWAKASLVGGA